MSSEKDETETNDEKVEETSNEEEVEPIAEEKETAKVAEEKKEIKEEEEKAAPEEKKERKKEKEEEEEIVEERVYTVPLGRAWISPRKRISPRAVRMIRSFVMKHMKVDSDSVKITNEVNEKVWSRGIEKPPRKIRVRAAKNVEGIVTVYPAEGD